MTLFVAYLCVFFGGMLGALSRFGVQSLFSHRTRLPGWVAIIVVNILGCFVIGLCAAWLQGMEASLQLQHLKPLRLYAESQSNAHGVSLLVVGFSGAFTTFSTFSLDNFFLYHGRRGWLAFNVIFSVGVGYLAVWLGWTLGHLASA
jgi:CrcB protein